MAQKTRKERITKADFYKRGGFSNPALFRLQSRGGAWRYYVSLDHHNDSRPSPAPTMPLDDAMRIA